MTDIIVSVIIPFYGDPEQLRMCLQALTEQTFSKNKFEVIIVNNYPAQELNIECININLRILNESKPGSYAARNKGVQSARGEILGFCDSDCIPEPEWINNAVRFLNINPEFQRVGGKIKLFVPSSRKPGIVGFYEQIFGFRQDEYVQKGSAATANMFSRKSVFEAVGLFNDNLLSGADLLWGYRAKGLGIDIGYCQDSVVRHPVRQSLTELVYKSRRVMSGYIVLNNADMRKRPANFFRHALIMLKPPIRAWKMIMNRKDIEISTRISLYGLEYLLKLLQLYEFFRLNLGGGAKR